MDWWLTVTYRFLYGGVSDQIRDTSPEVYVLSLPGFVFFKGPIDAPPRSDHQCAIVGKGQRQMISVGGVDGENRTFTAPTTADPWTYGIGILDLSELRWKDTYDPKADAYDSPTIVKDWYEAGNLEHTHWDSEQVEAIFTGKDLTPTPTPTHQSTASNAHSTGTIVGGAVGGFLGAAAIGMVSFLLVRRRRRAGGDMGDSEHDPSPADGDHQRIAEYKPEPWPKDHQGARFAYSPDSLLSGATVRSPSVSPHPYSSPYHGKSQDIHGTWRCELPGHQDGIATIVGGELPGTEPPVGELMDPSVQWAYELPAPLKSHRSELPDRKYSQ